MPKVTCRRCGHIVDVDDNGAYTFGTAGQRQCMSPCADAANLQQCRFLENSIALELGTVPAALVVISPSSLAGLRERRKPRDDID